MANILFKKGSYADFKTKVLDPKAAVEGALYLTENDGGLYIGKSDKTVQRIQGSVVFWPDLVTFSENVNPPYATDVIYFLAKENSLIRWDDTNKKWIVLNQTAEEVTSAINALNQRCDAIEAVANRADATASTAVQKDGSVAMTGNLDLGNKSIVNVANLTGSSKGTDAANKNYVDAVGNSIIGGANDTKESMTVKGAHLAAADAKSDAGTAQTRADNAYALAETKLSISGAETMSGDLKMGTHSITGVKNMPENATGDYAANKAYVDGKHQAATLEMQRLEGLIDDAQEDADKGIADAKLAQQAADKAQADATSALTKIGDANSGLTKAVNDANLNAESRLLKSTFDTFIAGAESSTLKAVETIAKKGVADADLAQRTADARVKIAGDTMTGHLTLHADPTAAMHAATKKYVDAAKAAAEKHADDLIAANDAMEFKGVVHATSDLPTTGVQRGWTYKVGTAATFTLKTGTTVAAKIGDLLINKAADNATPEWEHVSSGYEDTYLQKLKLAANQIHITNGIDDNFKSDLGAFKFVGASGTNLSFSNAEENGVITVTANMVWGSF
jgi:hypothetical protein